MWLAPTVAGLVAVDGLLEVEAGAIVLSALEPLARPAAAGEARTGSQRPADALTELARRSLEGGQLPRTGGVRPQLAVVVDFQSLLGRRGGWVGRAAGRPDRWPRRACRRLACDSAITRCWSATNPATTLAAASLTVTTTSAPPQHRRAAAISAATMVCDLDRGLAGWLGPVMARLPAILGGAPTQPLNLGRSTRVISPGQRTALAVRDGGCAFLPVPALA